MAQLAEGHTSEFDRGFAANHQALPRAGHWGVPAFVHEGETFFGRDRFDQLLRRMGIGD